MLSGFMYAKNAAILVYIYTELWTDEFANRKKIKQTKMKIKKYVVKLIFTYSIYAFKDKQ